MQRSVTYAVGDVHGRADLLEAAVAHARDDAAARGASPRFAFVGDVCDRGPHSMRCFEIVAETLAECPGSFLVRGNHDDMFLRALGGSCESRFVAAWLGRGGVQTLESYCRGDLNGAAELVRTVYRDHLRLVEDARSIVVDGGFAYTHAGVSPLRPLEMQDPHDLMWVRDPFLGHVGYLARVVVHGHTVVGDLPVVTENRVSIDTGAYKSGRLTVAVIDGDCLSFFQTDGCAARVNAVEAVRLDRGLGTALDGFVRHAEAA
jgi:Uncharacterized protein conserved in bacteria